VFGTRRGSFSFFRFTTSLAMKPISLLSALATLLVATLATATTAVDVVAGPPNGADIASRFMFVLSLFSLQVRRAGGC
jgi:hypothetical protein